MTQKKVLIVDDSKLMRIIIKKILSDDNLFVVTGEAGNGIEALAELEREMPDIISVSYTHLTLPTILLV